MVDSDCLGGVCLKSGFETTTVQGIDGTLDWDVEGRDDSLDWDVDGILHLVVEGRDGILEEGGGGRGFSDSIERGRDGTYELVVEGILEFVVADWLGAGAGVEPAGGSPMSKCIFYSRARILLLYLGILG